MPSPDPSQRGDVTHSPRPVARPPLSRKRRVLFAFLTLGLVLVVIEIALQLFYFASVGAFLLSRTTAPIFMPDELRGFRTQSDLDYVHRTDEFAIHIYTNSLGLRTGPARETVPYAKDPDEYRVLFLGPSFAFGWGSEYEDTYVARLAEGLHVPGKRVVAINLGTPAQGPGAQLCWLEHEGYRYQPDLVVQTSYGESVGHMPVGCPEQIARPVVEGGRLYSTQPTFAKRVRASVKNLGIVFYGFHAVRTLLQSGASDEASEVGKELYADEAGAPPSRDSRELVERYLGYERFVKRRLGEASEVAFLHIPLSFVAHEQDAARWRHITRVSAEQSLAWTRADVAALQRAGVKIADASEALREAGRDQRMYYWLDIHLTPAGNRVVADTVLPLLQQLASEQSPTAPSIGATRPRIP